MIENDDYDARDADRAIARANAEEAYLRGLLRHSDEDGAPFGIADNDNCDAYLVVVNADRSADLHRVEAGIVGERLVHVPSNTVRRVIDAAVGDFNGRLAAKGAPAGSWPQPGGIARFHPCFGRELEMVMHAGAEGPQLAPMTVGAWARMDGRARFALWQKWKAMAVEPWTVWATNEIVKLLHVEALNQREAARMAARCAEEAASVDDPQLASLVRPRYAGETDEDRAYRDQLWAEAKVYADDRRAKVAAMPEVG